MLTQIIKPQTISTQTVRNEISIRLNIAAQKIEKIEYWKHQLWINITGVGGKILSYRILPAWLNQAIMAIKSCKNLEQLYELGISIKLETQRFSQYYEEEFITKLRTVYGSKLNHLKAEEAQLEIIRQKQREAQKWSESWQNIIGECESLEYLESFYPGMEAQSTKYADFPEIIEEVVRTYCQKYEEFHLSNE